MQKILFLLLLQRRADKQLFCTKPQHSSIWQSPKSPCDIGVNYLITNTKIWSLEHSLVMIVETSAIFILIMENWQIKILNIYCNKVQQSKEVPQEKVYCLSASKSSRQSHIIPPPSKWLIAIEMHESTEISTFKNTE